MIILLLNILVGAMVSFAGSLPVGVINITAMQIGWSKGIRAACSFAVACAVIEAIYSTVAVVAANAFIHTDSQRTGANLVSIVVLLIGGVYYWRKHPTGERSSTGLNVFSKGILLSLINLAAVPFWLVYTAILQTHHWISINSFPTITTYIIGISLGTALALLTFATIGKQAGRHLNPNVQWINKVTGTILFGSGLIQAATLAQGL